MDLLRFTAMCFGLLLSHKAAAEGIGIVAPLTGPSAILGEQVRLGAATAAAIADIPVETADDACTAEGGAAGARRLVERQVSMVVGFLCTASIEAAMPILKDAGIPVIAVGVRTDSLTDSREKTGWPVVRLAPRADSERSAAAAILTELWREEFFAIVDDGTIYGRELAETFRLAAEQAGLKPVFVDTFRPQMENQIALVGRLRRAGATHVFVGGDRDDVAIMGRDAAELGYDLTIAGGEMLRAAPGAVPLAEGTLMIAMPEWADVADGTAVEAIRSRGAAADGYALPAYAAVQVASAAMAKAPDSPIMEALSADTFATALGPIRFDAKGDLAENPYRLFRFENGRFRPMGMK